MIRTVCCRCDETTLITLVNGGMINMLLRDRSSRFVQLNIAVRRRRRSRHAYLARVSPCYAHIYIYLHMHYDNRSELAN